MNKTRDNIYDINSYTDKELFDLLDLNNPTDRELEAKILHNIYKYNSIGNDSAIKIAHFFYDIYERFFDILESEEEIEGEEIEENINITVLDDNDNEIEEENKNNIQEGFTTRSGSGSGSGRNPYNYKNTELGNYNVSKNGSSNGIISENNYIYNNGTIGSSAPTKDQLGSSVEIAKIENPTSSNIGFTTQLEYAKDKLNPLLKQTIKRIISIDSQYRDLTNYPLSTDFTFNLSEPLRDVVSLKLYSIQIPYTWYTINNNFGSNFLYIKGNVPGLDNGNHDIKVSITAGNYSPQDLIKEVNNSFSTWIDNSDNSINYDVSFGKTSVTYNMANSKATINLDIKKIYSETQYYLEFPYWTTPYDENNRNLSLPSFFGFESDTYYPFTIYSNRTLPLTTATDTETYDVSGINNYFNVIHYQGPDEYDASYSYVYEKFKITLSLTTGTTYSRSELLTDINTQLSNNKYLSESSISIIDVDSDPSYNGYGEAYARMRVKLNRYKTYNDSNAKICIEFPDESTISSPIWSGTNSAFDFSGNICELNTLISENNAVQTNYKIVSSPYFKLICTKDNYGYDSSGNKIDTNDYEITIPNYTDDASVSADGYLLEEYLSAINTAISDYNDNTKATYNTNGELYNTYITTNTSSSKAKFYIQINKIFSENYYYLDFSGSGLYDLLNITDLCDNDVSAIDLSDQYIFKSTFPISGGGYTITGSYFFNVTPKSGYGNEYASTFYVSNPTTKPYNSYQKLQEGINSTFRTFTDTDGDTPFRSSSVSFEVSGSYIVSTLKIKINKKLSTSDYYIQFYDPSANDGSWDQTTDTSWYYYLKLEDNSYNLVDYVDASANNTYSTITGYKAIYSNEITISSENNYFYLTPFSSSNGLYDETLEHQITITVPVKTGSDTAYTRDELISTINDLFDSNEITSGMYFDTVIVNNLKYTKLRFNMNKIFRPTDYRLVFYDPYSFVTCTSSSKTIRNTTWDSTLGWIMGFREQTEYDLSGYLLSDRTALITGDTVVSVFIYNYFMIILDDYNQNHLNDGLITTSQKDQEIPLPKYSNKSTFICNPATNEKITSYDSTTGYNKLTKKQLYATQKIIETQINTRKTYTTGPFAKDVFGLIPMKVSGMNNNSTYIEFGGTLQNQERTYFGPVNIHRMSIRLLNDRGDIVDLNGANWSFSLISDQIYQEKPTSKSTTM